jgi:hypothetical protein
MKKTKKKKKKKKSLLSLLKIVKCITLSWGGGSAPQNLLPFLNEANISACQIPPPTQVIPQMSRKITKPFCYEFHLLQRGNIIR